MNFRAAGRILERKAHCPRSPLSGDSAVSRPDISQIPRTTKIFFADILDHQIHVLLPSLTVAAPIVAFPLGLLLLANRDQVLTGMLIVGTEIVCPVEIRLMGSAVRMHIQWLGRLRSKELTHRPNC